MDEANKQVGEMTLTGAIEDLRKLSWKIKGLVFEETPIAENVGNPTPQPADKLTRARNDIVKVNSRFSEIARRLELIGK